MNTLHFYYLPILYTLGIAGGGLLYAFIISRYQMLNFNEGIQFAILMWCFGNSVVGKQAPWLSRPMAIILMCILTALFVIGLEYKRRRLVTERKAKQAEMERKAKLAQEALDSILKTQRCQMEFHNSLLQDPNTHKPSNN